MKIATVTSKGQITIPVEVRRELQIRPGSRVVFSVRNGTAVLTSRSTGILQYAGSVPAPARSGVAGDWKAEERAAHRAACRKERPA